MADMAPGQHSASARRRRRRGGQRQQQQNTPVTTASTIAAEDGAALSLARYDARPKSRGSLQPGQLVTHASGGSGKKKARKKGGASTGLPASDYDVSLPDNDGTGLVGIRNPSRQTLPINANVLGMIPWMFLARRQYEGMDITTLSEGLFTGQQLISLLADAWPELGLALWNMQRLAASDWQTKVRSPDKTREDPTGQSVLEEILGRVNKNWGGVDAVVAQWITSVITQGACAGETVPNIDITDVLDIVPAQPYTIYFQRDIDQNFVAFQWQPMLAVAGSGITYGSQADAHTGGSSLLLDVTKAAPAAAILLQQRAKAHGGFREMNEETFAYVPLDTEVDDPYGRMPFAPAQQLVAFDAQLLRDLRQWSHVNAFGRIDVTVLSDKVESLMPTSVKADPTKAREWRDKILYDIRSAYNNINPDDTMVHFDNIEVTQNVRASGTPLDVDTIMKVLERRIFRALKQLPILMGSNEGTTETWGTLQMEVYAKGIQSIQKVVATLMERLFTAALRIAGYNCSVEVTFEALRSVDRLADARAEAAEDKNAAFKRDQGWITQDDASMERTGSKSVAPGPDPDPAVAPLQPDAGAGNGTGGANEPPPPPDTSTEGDGGDGKKDGNDAAQKESDGKSKTAEKPDDPNAANDGGKPASKSPAKGRTEASEEVAVRAANSDDEKGGQVGAMLGFFLPEDAAQALAIPGGEAPGDLHMTLAFMGKAAEISEADTTALHDAVRRYAASSSTEALEGQVAGVGRFTSVPEGAPHTVYAAADIPHLNEWRAGLLDALDTAGVGHLVNHEHGFTPHITLAYVAPDAPNPVNAVEAVPLRFGQLTVALGDERTHYPLGGGPSEDPERESAEESDAEDDDTPNAPPNPPGAWGAEIGIHGAGDAHERATGDASASGESDGPKAERQEAPQLPEPPDTVAPNPERQAQARRLENDVRAHYAGRGVSQATLAHMLALHTNNAAANVKSTWPPLAEAIRLCTAMAEARRAHDHETQEAALASIRKATPEEHAALTLSLQKMLERDYPDVDEDLSTILVEARRGSWDAAGAAALKRVGLSGQYHLTNAALLARMTKTVDKNVAGIQATMRKRLATVLARAIESGGDQADLERALTEAMPGIVSQRSLIVSQTETADAWGEALQETWARNGIMFKVWRTTGDPDPHSKEAPCLDNAYAGAIPILESFPSGAFWPPAHPLCQCTLEPSGPAPGAAAMGSPWLGD